MKEIMIIPLVICIMLALPLTVFSADLDDVVANVGYITHFTFVENPSGWENGPFLASAPIGYQPHQIIFPNLGWNSTDYPMYQDVYTEITTTRKADIYMCWPTSFSSVYTNSLFIELNGTTLDAYHDPTGDFVASSVYYEPWVDVDFVNKTAFTSSQNNGTFSPTNFLYIKFVDVPAGSYKFKSPQPTFTGIDGSWTQPSTFWGFYVNDPYGDFNFFDIWYDPEAPLQDQIDSINDTLIAGLDTSNNIDYEHFYTTFATYQLQTVIAQAEFEDKAVVNGFSDDITDIVNDYSASGTVDTFVDTLADLSSAYTEVLSECQTIEGGKYASGIYQARQQQLFIYAQLKAGEKLDSAISDAELDRADDYYAKEEQLLSEFKLQSFNDAINYSEWFNLIVSYGNDPVLYRSIYDWFFNDSSFKFWIVIPISFTIVSIVLGTRIKLNLSNRGDDHD